MTITTCQKVTLISCSVLCVSLFLPRMLLPRGKKEKGQPEVGPGFYHSVIHQFSVSDDPEQWDMDPSPSLTHTIEAMVKIKSIERGKKYNLMGQVIPIYGFGILLYILYIIHKLSNKEKMNKSGIYTAVKMTNMPNKTGSDYELTRLQERLLKAEMMMERITSGKSHCSSRKRKGKISTSKKEEKLLRQIRQITLLMQEGRLEGASPEREAEEVPYGADWEGYPEETYPEYDDRDPSYRHRFEKLRLEEPPSQLTAEALAERMEQEEEEIMARKLSIVQEEDEEEDDREEEVLDEEEEELDEEEEEAEDCMEGVEEGIKEDEDEEDEDEEEDDEEEKKQLLSPSPPVERKQERVGLEVSRELQRHSGGRKQISFSDRKHVFHYPKEEMYEVEEKETEDETEEDDDGTVMEEEEEDPLTEAESLQFSCEGSSNPEEDAEEETEEYLLMLAPVGDEGHLQADVPKEVGQSGLRMRNRREHKELFGV
ncbi:protein RIC-3 [Kryptolebias marmoratus]|uniref:RIC3 acetylcholine receptor chaperone n=1 Tax=Kryptolebias marmoratus TaxID=37003 RepID=A0A3Q3EVK0_KRYMA|nr:protein RIC-3 [Kryptolebias marmoratus]